jgi:hypothetical protein
MTTVSRIYSVRNRSEITMKVIVEPWAEEFAVPSDSILSLKILYIQDGPLETEVGADYFTIWLWAGSRAEVSLDGRDQTPRSLSIPAPP